jgi:hypothetical protein
VVERDRATKIGGRWHVADRYTKRPMLIGAAAFWLFPLVAGIVALLASRRRWHGRTRAILAVVILPIWVLLLVGAYGEAHYWDGYDLNPTQNDLVGRWRSEDEELTLDGDGTFRSSDGSRGKWTFHPLMLVFTNAQEWAAVRRNGELVLLKIHDEDPDSWNKHRAYERQR